MITAAIVFAAAFGISVTSVAQEVLPSVEGPRYGACVVQHPNDFGAVCAELRLAFKAETMARHGYVNETIADPPAYCRNQVLWQIEQLVKAMNGDPQYQAMVRNSYSTMYSECLAYAAKKTPTQRWSSTEGSMKTTRSA